VALIKIAPTTYLSP